MTAREMSATFVRLLEDSNEVSSFSDFLQKRSGAFIAYVIGGMALLVLIYCVLREYVYYKCGYDFCPGPANRNRNRAQRRQLEEDERLAFQIQQELAEEDRVEMRNQRRAERRRKYEQFLKSYTAVVKSEDFFQSVEKEDGTKEISPAKTQDPGEDTTNFEGVQESGSAVDDRDVEAGVANDEEYQYEVDEPDLLLKLPIKGDDGEDRYVEGSCSVCLLEYEAGDSVVWSTRKVCPHAFHEECILVWLSKGKKRCPICRNFFVPGTSIDDKKEISHDENDAQAGNTVSALYEDEEEEMEGNGDPLSLSIDSMDIEGPGEISDVSRQEAADMVISRRLSREVGSSSRNLDSSDRSTRQMNAIARRLSDVSRRSQSESAEASGRRASGLQVLARQLSNLSVQTESLDSSGRRGNELRVIADRVSTLSMRSDDLETSTSSRRSAELRVLARHLSEISLQVDDPDDIGRKRQTTSFFA